MCVLASLTIEKIPIILNVIDRLDHTQQLNSELIPQFADDQVIDDVARILSDSRKTEIEYGDMGYFLLREERNLAAHRKYGENYGKGAALLGLACYKPGLIMPSSLTSAYAQIQDTMTKRTIRNLLMLRIPLIQRLLFRGLAGKFNGYSELNFFSASTKIRRGQCPRRILPELSKLDATNLKSRVENIYW